MTSLVFTKQDYLDLYEKNRTACIIILHQMIEDAYRWEYVRDLDDDDAGIEDETHMVDVWDDPEDGKTKRMQFEFVFDENSNLSRIGFTPEEIKDLILENGTE